MSSKIMPILKIFLEKFKKNFFKNYLFLALLASFVALISAYISQYIFGLEPCILCYHQRKPFFIIIVISLIFLLIQKLKKYQKFGAILCAITFLINAGIAFYHSGVEMKFFEGPKTCSISNIEDVDDLEQLTKFILSSKAVKCDQPQFHFMKLTMANWNFLYSLGFFLIIALQIFLTSSSKKI